MTASALPASVTTQPSAARVDWIPLGVAGAAFAFLFAKPAALLAGDWWSNPEAGHGLLLAPVAVYLAWKSGIREGAKPNLALGVALLLFAVLVRYASGLAAELFTMKVSMLIAAAGLIAAQWGGRQLLHWWLPVSLFVLAVPLPALVLNAIALPLQFKASTIGAALLRSRDIPVLLAGNVIRVPGHELFVAEACSGLRSLTALISIAVLAGGIGLRFTTSRVALVAVAIPVAVLINGVRIFLTGFLVLFVGPEFADGFMHTTEGWAMFVISLSILGSIAWMMGKAEDAIHPLPGDAHPDDAVEQPA
jgi:exosortase